MILSKTQPTGVYPLGDHGDPYPRRLSLIATTHQGYVVDADGARRYLDISAAWRLMADLVHPALNVEPEGNC